MMFVSLQSNDGGPARKRRLAIDPGLAAIVAAVILAAGGVAGGFIGRATAPARTNNSVAQPTATVTVTVPAPSSGGSTGSTGGASPSGSPQGGTARSLTAQLLPGSSVAIDLDKGLVLVNLSTGNGDFDYEGNSNTGAPELVHDQADAYSVAITSADASEQQCQTATNEHPDGIPITNFHKGLLICVATSGGGMALLEQTQPLGAQKTLQLREVYWPNPGT
jgi:hypothetical protein